jgi:hypothetical protein
VFLTVFNREKIVFFFVFPFLDKFPIASALAFLPLLVRVGDLFSLSLVSLSFGKEGRRSRSLFSSLSRVEDSLPSLALLLFGIEVFDRERENEYIKREERDGVKVLNPICVKTLNYCAHQKLSSSFLLLLNNEQTARVQASVQSVFFFFRAKRGGVSGYDRDFIRPGVTIASGG